jgi:TPR repeat protein
MGSCYDKGTGVPENAVEAVKWWRKAADQGCAKAQVMMGLCYFGGYGLTKDDVEAYAYYNLAGEADTRKLRDNLEKRMSAENVVRGQQRTKQLQKEIEARILAKKTGK